MSDPLNLFENNFFYSLKFTFRPPISVALAGLSPLRYPQTTTTTLSAQNAQQESESKSIDIPDDGKTVTTNGDMTTFITRVRQWVLDLRVHSLGLQGLVCI